jgi:hypothetical protein
VKSVPIEDPFFQGDALLLVEDPLTAVVLRECWVKDPQARRIVVRPVGGRESVNRLVQAAREQKRHNVFGFVDRDFGEVRTGPEVFSTHAHEIENELLNSAVIAALSGQPVAQIDLALQSAAQKLIDWMGVRYLLQQRKLAWPPFPSDPSAAEASQKWVEAEAQKYCDGVKRWTASEIPSEWRDTWLQTHRPRAQAECAGGQWRVEFSGKELFAAVAQSVTGRRFSGTQEDRARAIAGRWRKQPPLSTPAVPVCIQRVQDRIVTDCGL